MFTIKFRKIIENNFVQCEQKGNPSSKQRIQETMQKIKIKL